VRHIERRINRDRLFLRYIGDHYIATGPISSAPDGQEFPTNGNQNERGKRAVERFGVPVARNCSFAENESPRSIAPSPEFGRTKLIQQPIRPGHGDRRPSWPGVAQEI
jgi:hypothetical protein